MGSELHLPPKKGCASLNRRPGLDFPVTGKRVVLFLVRDESAGAWQAHADWRCWIEGGQAYSYAPEPGPEGRPLGPLGMSEVELRGRVLRLRADKATLAALHAHADPTHRIEGAGRLLGSDVDLVAEDAFKVLGGCGRDAVPLLLAHVDGERSTYALRALGAIGDVSAVPPLVQRIERELAFWTEAKKGWTEGWWQRTTEAEQSHYETRLHVAGTLISTLQHMPSRAYEDVARRFRSLCTTPPDMRDVPYIQFIVHACDAALSALPTTPAPTR